MERHEPEPTTSVDMAALLADPAGSAAFLDGRYRLGEVLGEGGMSVVHRAHDTLLHRPVAVKLLRESVSGTAERARFTGEVRTLGALSHAGLVTVLDAGVTARRPYLVMELVEGGTLADVAAPVALHVAADIGAQVASALAYAHERGIIHRDVKPANVLLGPNGRVKLADFGIARIVGDTVHHTQTGALIGTISYLSPEQVEGGELTTALDVYSLGLVLLELITGRRAFPGPSVEAALSRLTRPPEMPLDLPAAWWVLLTAMTARNPAERPSAAEVSERLSTLRAGTGTAGNPVPSAVAPAPVAAPARTLVPQHVRGVLVAVAALILLIVTAAAAGGNGVRGNAPRAVADPAQAAPAIAQPRAPQDAGAALAQQTSATTAHTTGGRAGTRSQEPRAGKAAKPAPAPKPAGGHKPGGTSKAKNDVRGKDKGKDQGNHGKHGGKHGPKHR